MDKKQFYQNIFLYILVLVAFLAILSCSYIFFSSDNTFYDKSNPNNSKTPAITVELDPDSVESEAPEITEEPVRTEFSADGAVIWPLRDLDMYAEAGNSEKLGTCPKGEHLTILEQSDIYFKVNYEDQEGYIDGRYCLINLPDYFGNAIGYDITNSYSSIFMAHEYELPEITDTVIVGYEGIYRGADEYYVPFLYPCALRLERVVEKVNADGLRLKIYDAFRPHKATRFLYDTVESVMDKSVGSEEDAFTYPPAGSVIFADGSIIAAEGGTIPAGTVVAPAGSFTDFPAGSVIGDEGAVINPATGENLGTATLPDLSKLSYRKVITGGSYKLSAFLAKEGSAHNKGIALDLTLYDPETGKELEMQSAMHDLSHNSVTSKNNDNANLLAKYMKDEGFNGLSSEWWHFQDDETRNLLGIRYNLEEGLN